MGIMKARDVLSKPQPQPKTSFDENNNRKQLTRGKVIPQIPLKKKQRKKGGSNLKVIFIFVLCFSVFAFKTTFKFCVIFHFDVFLLIFLFLLTDLIIIINIRILVSKLLQ